MKGISEKCMDKYKCKEYDHGKPSIKTKWRHVNLSYRQYNMVMVGYKGQLHLKVQGRIQIKGTFFVGWN